MKRYKIKYKCSRINEMSLIFPIYYEMFFDDTKKFFMSTENEFIIRDDKCFNSFVKSYLPLKRVTKLLQ